MNGKDKAWPKARMERLAELWATGASASKIGAQIGISRNAVVGKAHRMGLPSRPSSGGRPKGSTKPWYATPSAKPRPKAPGLKTLIELAEDECRWPVGEMFCGQPAEHRRPYCEVHMTGAFQASHVQRSRPKASTPAGEGSKARGVAAP